MSRTYKAIGINLKAMPLGEADRLVTILTPEYGLIRAVAPGARKYNSKLNGKTELFVVNQLLLAQGRSLDKLIQADTIDSYAGLSSNLGKLAASQYLAEIILCLALSEQPQTELYAVFNEHLRRLQQLSSEQNIFPSLAHGVFHLLVLAGIAPQVHACCLTQKSLIANFSDPLWRVGFSFNAGGLVNLTYKFKAKDTQIHSQLGAVELTLLQHLGAKDLPNSHQLLSQFPKAISLETAWVRVERLLRDYTQYHVGRSIRSASLLELSYVEF